MDFSAALVAPNKEERNSRIDHILQCHDWDSEDCADSGWSEFDVVEDVVISDQSDGNIQVCGTIYADEIIPSGCKDNPRVQKISVPFEISI